MATINDNTADSGLATSGLGATWQELRRVVWPTRAELFRMTGIVVFTVVAIAIFIFAIDAVLGWAITTFKLYGTSA